MAKKITAKVTVAAKTGGLKLEGYENWFNPANDNVKAYVKPELRGKTVELTLSEDSMEKFSFVREKEGSEEGAKPTGEQSGNISREEYWTRREQRDIQNSERVSRHGALNTAIEVIRLHHATGGVTEPLSEDAILESAKDIAEKILEFTNGGSRSGQEKAD